MRKAFSFFSLTRWAMIGALGAVVVACAPRLDSRGNMPSGEKFSELRPGEFSRQEILEILGSPSSTAAFGQETWYYVSKRTETMAFLEPKILQRQVLELRFDKDGVLRKIKNLDLADGYVFDKVERTTPVTGSKMTILEQLFGNIGRFE